MTRAYNTATTQQNSGGAVAGVTAGKNFVINGAFDFWQRGTSIAFTSGTRAYCADRWDLNAAGTNNAATASRQLTNDTTNLPNIQYCARIQRNSGQTGTGGFYFATSLETVNSIPFAGKTVTVSFYARAGANYSPTSSALGVGLYSGTGTDENKNASYTGNTYVGGANPSLTTTWQRFTFTGTVGATATELAIQFSNAPTGTAGANDYFEVTGVQLEVGSVATPFSRAGGTIQGELAACQRYFFRQTGANASQAYTIFANALAPSTTNVDGVVFYPVRMRTTPTISASGAVRAYDGSNWLTNSGVSIIDATEFSGGVRLAVSGATQFRPYKIQAQADSAAYLDYSSEL